MSYFNKIPTLRFANKVFVVDKFSGFDKVEISIDTLDAYTIIITYSMNIYFSGECLKLEKQANLIIDKKRSWFKTEYTPEYKFYTKIKDDGIEYSFKNSGYKSGKSTSIIPDFVRWFAKNTNTIEKLEELKEDINYCLEYINKHYSKKIEK